MFEKRMPKVFRTQSVTAAPQDFRPFQVRRLMCVFFSGLWPIQCATLAEIWRRCHYSTTKFRNRKIKAIWLETILQNGWLNHSSIMPKPFKYHCRRRATPPHPRDTGHLKQGDGKREIGRLPRHRRRIMYQRWARGSQKGANGSQKGAKEESTGDQKCIKK